MSLGGAVTKEEEDAFFDDDVLVQLLRRLQEKKECGIITFRALLRRRLQSLTPMDIPAWKRMRRYIGKDKEFSKEVFAYLCTLPHLHLDVFLALCQELTAKKVEQMFFIAAEADVPDYIVILLRYLSDIGITFTWYDLFKRLQQEGKMESIRHIMLSSGHSFDTFLCVFENALHRDKEMVEFIFSVFPQVDEGTLHEIALTSTSKETRGAASSQLHKVEDFDFEDPFEGTVCTDAIAWLADRIGDEITPEDEELESLITSQNGPLNARVEDPCKDEDSICSHYGGCRLYTCLCREERKTSWFRRRCLSCGSEIATKLEAYRIPCSDGGWIGCYCHPDCFRSRDKKKCVKRWNLIEELLREKST